MPVMLVMGGSEGIVKPETAAKANEAKHLQLREKAVHVPAEGYHSPPPGRAGVAQKRRRTRKDYYSTFVSVDTG